MAIRWEFLAEPQRGGEAEWETLQFDLPDSQESIEESFSRGHSAFYNYTATHTRSWGQLERSYEVSFLSMTQSLLVHGKECERIVRRVPVEPRGQATVAASNLTWRPTVATSSK